MAAAELLLARVELRNDLKRANAEHASIERLNHIKAVLEQRQVSAKMEEQRGTPPSHTQYLQTPSRANRRRCFHSMLTCLFG